MNIVIFKIQLKSVVQKLKIETLADFNSLEQFQIKKRWSKN